MCIWADLLYFPRGSAPLASFGRRRVEGEVPGQRQGQGAGGLSVQFCALSRCRQL